MIISSTKLLTLPILLSVLLGIAKGQSVEKLCKKHEKEFNELFVEKKGDSVTEILWEESLEKKEDKEEEKKRLEEQKETEKAKGEEANAKNVSWLSTLLGIYLCKGSVITKTDTNDKPYKKYEPEFAVIAEKEIFAKIRRKFNITDEELLLSLSLSDLVPLNGRGGSGGVFYKTKDDKYILKNLNPDHDEPAKMADMLSNYKKHVLGEENGQQPEEGKQSTDSRSMMNTFYMYFEMNIYAKLKEGQEKDRKKVLRLRKLQFVLLNNAFVGIDEQTLLKFDIKGTFSPGSAVQYDQKQKWYTGTKDWQQSFYREYDFIGMSRDDKKIDAFFPEGIQLTAKAYIQLAEGVENDARYLIDNGLNDYSLLLGVKFMDPYPADKKYPEETKEDAMCVQAKCHNCKLRPDAKYEEELKLCLYMAIIDIVTPSNAKTEKHFLKMLTIKVQNGAAEFGHYQSMSEFIPYHNEIVTPVPPEIYGKRFIATIIGCLFSPELPTPKNELMEMRKRICHSFGEKEKSIDFPEDDAWKKLVSLSYSLLISDTKELSTHSAKEMIRQRKGKKGDKKTSNTSTAMELD
ncbi:hypothetical protein niasHT_010694 [Heterodera trifolii]|uniref:PIPK domain-containing protein n=1 Tax=Heterodera trifolii TaxID=157864 RepID=A0ABD2LA87_9BILA